MTYNLADYDPDEDSDRWITDECGRVIRDRLDELRAVTCLEVGCGVGRMTEILLGSRNYRKRRIVATDRSKSMIDAARARRPLPNVTWTTHDLNRIVGPFDAVVCCLVLHEVENPSHMLEWFGRLLAPGGRVFVTVPSAKSLHYEGKPMLGERARRFGVRRIWTPQHWYDVLVDGTGLRVVAREELMLKPYPSSAMQCLGPDVLAFLAGYRGPGGAIAYYELRGGVMELDRRIELAVTAAEAEVRRSIADTVGNRHGERRIEFLDALKRALRHEGLEIVEAV